MTKLVKIGFGGGCHWCTEAVFLSLKGVVEVQQGWIASKAPHQSFSEAVVVSFNSKKISLKDLIAIHLHTHKSTSNHTMREKYRSAVYYFSQKEENRAIDIINKLQVNFDEQIITQVLPFTSFKASLEEHQNYYYNNPEKPFCKTYIHPKLQLLLERFREYTEIKK